MSTSKFAMTIGIPLLASGLCLAQPAQEVRPTPDPDVVTLVQGNTRFALELYDQLREQDGNLFFSPASISAALAMTYGGARGTTAAEMAQVLHFELEPERLHPAFGKLLAGLDTADDEEAGYRLYVANALWPQKKYPFLPEFINLCQMHYAAGLQEVDYINATEQARRTINTWVAERTEGKIEELLKPGILDALTRLVLTNAIYFKGDWAAKFDPEETEEAPFTLLDGTQVKAPLMNQTGQFGYLEADDLQVLELPYAGKTLSMVILLPRAHDGLSALEKSLDARKLAGWLAKLRRREVRVALPRFEMSAAFRLADVLKAMGMRAAFDPRAADLSGMDGSRWLYISAVVHQAFVDVNEEGTEAAAATGVVITLKASPKPPPVFRADHPFLFLIRDTHSGSILFLGRMLDPKA
jgi:serpin B